MIDTDTREAELKALSWDGRAEDGHAGRRARRSQALMAESAKYESFTRGGGGFPVILSEGKGVTVKDPDGNLYIDMAAGVGRQRRGPQPPEGAGRDPPAVRRDHAHHGHHQPQAHRAGQAVSRRSCPKACAAIATPPSPRPAATPWRAAMKFARASPAAHQIIAFHGAYHGVWMGTGAMTTGYQLPPGLGPVHARRAAPALRLLLPLPVRQARTRAATIQCGKYVDYVLNGPYTGADDVAAVIIGAEQGEGGYVAAAAGVPRRWWQGACDEERRLLHRRRGAVGRRPHRQDVGDRALRASSPTCSPGARAWAATCRWPASPTAPRWRRRCARARSRDLRRQRHGLRGRDDQHRPDHRPGDRPRSAAPPRSARRSRGCSSTPCPTCPASATCAATASWSASRSSPTGRPRSRSPASKIGEITFKLLNAGILMTPCGRHANVFRFMPPLTIPRDYAVKASEIMIDILKAY